MEIIGGWLREVVMPGLSTLVLTVIFALLRRYLGKLDDERLRQLLLELVRAAEQIYGPGAGAQKRGFVMEKLREYGYTDVELEKLEAAVYELTEG